MAFIDGRAGFTHVDETGRVAGPQVVENGRLVQVGQVRHVRDLLELGWVHLLNLVLLYRLLLKTSFERKMSGSQVAVPNF